MHALEAEEEIVFLADAFLSHVPESGADLPAYRAWLDDQDFAPAYDHLHRMLQLLQWQKRQRGEAAERWVLKTPAHLGYLDVLRRRFPDLHLVHLHRDPVATIPSGASLNATLHAMHSDVVDPVRVGAQWIERMGFTNDRALATRARWDTEPGLVTDVQFEDAVADPLAQVGRVYDERRPRADRGGRGGDARMAHRAAARSGRTSRLLAGDLRPVGRPDPRAVCGVRRNVPFLVDQDRSHLLERARRERAQLAQVVRCR